MVLDFYKYHGAGNDFIVVDARFKDINLDKSQINLLCDRRFGIGADGLMYLLSSDLYDFKMRYFNSDGLEGSMCGNGGRCIVEFANSLGIQKTNYLFEAVDGLHEAAKIGNLIRLKMNDVSQIETINNTCFLNTGSPHVVKIIEQLDLFDVATEGAKLRHASDYGTEGTNVNFIRIIENQIEIRTFERGVEAETWACGTGAVASAIAAHFENPKYQEFYLKALGGHLKVSFDFSEGIYKNVWLEGPAVEVFKGQIEIES